MDQQSNQPHNRRHHSRDDHGRAWSRDRFESKERSSHHRPSDYHHHNLNNRERTHRNHDRASSNYHERHAQQRSSAGPVFHQEAFAQSLGGLAPANEQVIPYMDPNMPHVPAMSGALQFQNFHQNPGVASLPSDIWQPSLAHGVQLEQDNKETDGQWFSAASLEKRFQLPADKITETGIIPDAPYYELPAGLMVPLVPAHELDYKPLKPDELRLPLPKFPDERFLKLIESFYRSDSKSRDNDGWDESYIGTYLKQKEALAEMAQYK